MTTDLPEWGERLIDKIDASRVTPRRDRPAVGLKFPESWVALIQAAAKKRDLTMAAYARRALIAFVCHDLELDWDTVMAAEPRIHTYEQDAAPQAKAGAGHGKWRIGGLR